MNRVLIVVALIFVLLCVACVGIGVFFMLLPSQPVAQNTPLPLPTSEPVNTRALP